MKNNFFPMKKLALFTLLLCLFSTAKAQNLENLRNEKPFKMSSGVSLSTSFYAAQGVENRRAPFAWNITGSPTVEVYGFKIPFTVSLSNQHRSFQQPFNQVGLTPQYKWVKLHAGYSSARFSQFTLAGRRFLGGGMELTPGKWRIGYVQGRFQKAIAYDSVAAASSNIGQYPSAIPVPAFSRFGYAARLGYGNKKASFDLSYLKANDRETSIQIPNALARKLRPEENAVVGLQTQFTFFKKLTWATEVGVSAYSRDTRSDSIELPEKFAFMSKFLLPRLSTQVQTAGESSLNFRSKQFGMRVLYRRIDPDFRSMGAFFFQTDMEQWLVAPSVNLLKNRLQISGSYGWQNNNISETRSRTTRRTIGSANVSVRGGKHFNLTANYSNFGVTMEPRRTLAPTNLLDTFRLAQISHAVSISPNWHFGSKTRQQTFGLSASYNALEDLQKGSAFQSNMKTLSSNAFYSINFPQKKLGLNASLVYQNLQNTQINSQTVGINAGINKTYGKGNVTTGANAGWYSAGAGQTLQIGGNLSYRLSKKGSLFLNAQWQRTDVGDEKRPAWSEFFGNSGISFSF
jgi:hypothetical protein